MHACRAFQAPRCALEGGNAPVLHIVHVHVEGGLVELDDVHAVLLQRTCFLVQELGERHGELHLVAVVLVRDRVDDGHRPGQRELELAPGMRSRELRFGLMHPPFEPQRAGYHRHHRLVAVVADAHLHLAAEVDALDELEETVHEVLARLLAVGDDVDARVLLALEPEERGVPLRLRELVAGEAPRRPQLFRLREPDRFGKAAGNGGFQHQPCCRKCSLPGQCLPAAH